MPGRGGALGRAAQGVSGGRLSSTEEEALRDLGNAQPTAAQARS